jgi:hypothetical protein
MSERCDDCGAEIVFGEPHRMWVSTGADDPGRMRVQCEECADMHAWACWNEEEWGPYPSRLNHHKAGTA